MGTLHKLIGNVGRVRTGNSLESPSNVLYVAEFDTPEGKKYSVVNWRPQFADPNNNTQTVAASWVINDKGYVLAKVADGSYTIAAGVLDKLSASTAIAPINAYGSLQADVFDNDTTLRSVKVWNNDNPFTILGSGVTTAYIQTVFGTAYLGMKDADGDGIDDSEKQPENRSSGLLDKVTDFLKKNWLLVLLALILLYLAYREFVAKKKGRKK